MGFDIFGRFIPYYGFFIVVGIACASVLAFFLSRRAALDFYDVILISAYFVAFGFLGAKLLFLFVSRKSIDWKLAFSDLRYFNALMTSGFVFYGGFICSILALPAIGRLHGISLRPYLQILSPCAAVAHAFGRIGCSFAGCCYGKPTDWGICFVYRESIAAPNGIRLFPVQGIEAFCLFVFAAVFTAMVLKDVRAGIPELYVCLYSLLRFVLEFFRGDLERGFVGVLSTSQVLSLVLFIVVVVFKRLSSLWFFDRDL